jgi:hypothetical protein
MSLPHAHPMSRGERIAAIIAVWVVVAVVVTLNVISPWFRHHMADLQWVTGMITGWLLCSAVNRGRRP